MTNLQRLRASRKWRPSLGMVIIAILVSVMALPLVSLFFFRVYENHLVRQSEAELIAQSTSLVAIFVAEQQESPNMFAPAKEIRSLQAFRQPVIPRLDIGNAKLLGPREKGKKLSGYKSEINNLISSRFSTIIRTVQKLSPAEIVILDANGVVIAGGYEIGLSLKHVDEISAALMGSYASAVRQISTEVATHDNARLAHLTRIYTALPVVNDSRVLGVVYTSKQPKSVFTALYQQRYRLLLAAFIMVVATLFMGWVLTRAIARPIHNLIAMTTHIGSYSTIGGNISHTHGTRELAHLSDSFLGMSQKLIKRSDYISTFAKHVSHELKSPLTATRGAIELLLEDDDAMSLKQKRKFLRNILDDTQRLTNLVSRLHALAIAENPSQIGRCSLGEVIACIKLKSQTAGTELIIDNMNASREIAMSFENAEIVFSNLIENSIQHGASGIEIAEESCTGNVRILVSDNGSGVSRGNSERIFELFFTSRRKRGGTGMGLALVRTILDAHEGRIELIEQDTKKTGATFAVTIPAA